MTNSEPLEPEQDSTEPSEHAKRQQDIYDGVIDPVQGVLTGQVPVWSMPVAMGAPLELDGEWLDDDGSA